MTGPTIEEMIAAVETALRPRVGLSVQRVNGAAVAVTDAVFGLLERHNRRRLELSEQVAPWVTTSRGLLNQAVGAAMHTPDQWAPHVWSQLAAAAVAVERGEREAELHPEIIRVQQAFGSPPPQQTADPAVSIGGRGVTYVYPAGRDDAPMWLQAIVDAAARGTMVPSTSLPGARGWVVDAVLGTGEPDTGAPVCSCPQPVGRNPECDVHGNDACTCDGFEEEGEHDDGNPGCPRNQR